MGTTITIDTEAVQRLIKERGIDGFLTEPKQAASLLRAMKAGCTGAKGISNIASALNTEPSVILGYHGQLNTFQSLRLTRIEAGMTSAELSRKTGLFVNVLRQYEIDVLPGVIPAYKIAKALNKSIEEVFFRTVK